VVKLHIQRRIHRRHVHVLLLEGGNLRLVHETQPNVVQSLQQAFLPERIDLCGSQSRNVIL
jgi:hypothetical protein